VALNASVRIAQRTALGFNVQRIAPTHSVELFAAVLSAQPIVKQQGAR
jgi:hypothetical protein